MRKKLLLNGTWTFSLDPDKSGIQDHIYEKNLDDTIPLPGTTSMAKKGPYHDTKETGCLTDPYLYEGYAWYSRTITLDPSDLDSQIILYLERTRMTQVWVDGVFVGSADSLNTPHQYNLTPYLTKPEFRLTILVSNVDYPTKGGHLTSPDTQTNWNGIIGEISLHMYAPVYIESIRVFPDIDTKTATLELHTVNTTSAEADKTVTIDAELSDIHGLTGQKTPVSTYPVNVPVGKSKTTITYALGDNAVLWSEYTPVVYQLTAALSEEEKTITTFGLRKFSTTETAFLINGTSTFLRGKHDGLIFPLTAAVPATVDEWIRVMKISKSYGINHYRFHTCCPPEAAFTAADLLGIYMEPQLPFWGTITTPEDENHNEAEQQYLISEGYRMMDAFGNHASYCMMSLGNELWGSKEKLSQILSDYEAYDHRHLYTQGSNNFQHTPVILPEEDFFVGVRFSKHRLFRGSYGMCDAPLGHVQVEEPSTRKNYDEDIHPTHAIKENDAAAEIEIQYGTGVKKVKAAETDEVLIPHIPVVSHEIGQYCVYPNFHEIKKYTGVLKARNFEIFRDRLKAKGMLDQADDFFKNSGALAVQCYKEELEAAARTSLLAGYQILDIQDFSGQGTALVGILDAFMDSKGLITTEDWASFCSDGILLAQFDKYVWTAGEEFSADLAIRYYHPTDLCGKSIHWTFTQNSSILSSGDVAIPDHLHGLAQLGTISFTCPSCTEPGMYTLNLTVEGTTMHNHYELYLYPDQAAIDLSAPVIRANGYEVSLTCDFTQAKNLLAEGKRVLYLPNEVPESLEGFYCTDFWCYPMFRDICNWMKKPVAVGTMGLLINENHPALTEFPSHTYATPQWYSIVSHSRCAILDDSTAASYRPIVQMIDNFDRNHKLAILMEGKVGNGSLMICTSRLSEIMERSEVRQFATSLLHYLTSDAFVPAQELDMDKLATTFFLTK